MVIYWYVSIFISAIAMVEVFLSKQENTIKLRLYLFILCVFLLFTFGGIRGLGTGLDDFQYRSFFTEFRAKIAVEGLLQTISDFRFEPGIYLIAYPVSVFTKNPDIFMYVFCLIAVCVNAYYFKKLSPLPTVALAIYSAHLFINKDINQIRFGLSSAFFLGFVYHVYNKNKLKSLWLFILSFISHATGITAILIPLALIIRKNKYIPTIIVLASIPIAFMGSQIIISVLSEHLGALGERAMSYSNRDSAQEQGILTLSNIKNIILVIVFSYILLSNKLKNENPEKFSFFYILVISFAIGSGLRIALQDYASGGRLANYLLQTEPVLISICIYETKKLKKMAAIVITLMMVLYYLYYNTIAHNQSIEGYTVSPTFQIVN